MKMHLNLKKKAFSKAAAVLLVFTLVSTGIPLQVHAGDTWPFKGEASHGVNQPSVHGYTSGHILDWSPETDRNAEMLRSFVPLQKRIDPLTATQAKPNLNPNVKMTNVSGDYGNAFIENAAYTNKFAQYHFGFWQYVDYWSPWHGTATAYTPPEYYDDTAQSDWKQKWFEFGMMNIPNPTYTDAAHKNGVLSLAGIFFSNNDRGQQTYKQMLVKDGNGEFPVAKKMIEMAKYFGYDGYFINQEESGPNVQTSDIPDYIEFIKALKKGGLYVQWYDSLSTSKGSTVYARYFNDNNSSFLYDKNKGEAVSDSFFFDYGMGSSQITSSKNYLEQLNAASGTHYSIYDVGFAGLEAGRDRFDGNVGPLKSKLDANGVPLVSIATLGADFVHAGYHDDQPWPSNDRANNDYQWETIKREQQWWTGMSINPQSSDTSSWPGIASAITERSVIGNTNFYTNFNTGHGLSYYKAGAISNNDEWSNMSLQDVPVTWQWWQDTTGSRLTVDLDYGPKYKKDPSFSYEQIGGYDGGSSLAVSGNLDAENFLRLYKTDLSVNVASKLSITYNKPSAADASSMSIGLIFKDQPDTVVKVPVTDGSKTAGWTTKELDLSAYAGKEIAAFGLVFAPNGSAVTNYQMNVGQIRIYDGSAVVPAAPTGLALTNTFTDTNEMVINWNLNTDYSQVKNYNVYVNDVFVGGKYDKSFYIKKLPARSGLVKVVPVGADGREGTAASVPFNLDAAVSNIKADSKENGELAVSWTNPSVESDPITVSVKSLNWITTGTPVSATQTVPAGSTSAVFTGMPVNGDDYIVSIAVGSQSPVAKSGNFIDKTIEPYAEAWSWNGNTLNLPMPNTRDWRYLYVYENGVPMQFDTTYSSGNKPYIVRGRSVKASLSITPASTTSMITLVMEDYAGNKSTPLVVRDSELNSSMFPDAALLNALKEQGYTKMSDLAKITGMLDLSNRDIKDLTGLKLITEITGVNLSNTKLEKVSESDFPSKVTSIDLSNNANLQIITSQAFSGITDLQELNISGSSKLQLLDASNSKIKNLVYGDKTAFPELIVLDLSGTQLDMAEGQPARLFADQIKQQVKPGQAVTITKYENAARTSTVSGDLSDLSYLTDGDVSQNSYSMAYDFPCNVILDFGKEVEMTTFNMFAYDDTPTDFTLSYSQNGTDYTTIDSPFTGNTLQAFKHTFTSPIMGRYVKFEVTKAESSMAILTELELWANVPYPYPSSVKYNGYSYNGLFTVTFDADGGSNAPAPITNVALGSKIDAPADVAKEGYVFDGWYAGNHKWGFATDTVTDNLTLKARWVIDPTKTMVFTKNLESAKTVNEGNQVDLQVAADGGVDSMIWEVKAPAEDTWNRTTVTSSVYSFTAKTEDNGKKFRVVLTGKAGIQPSTLTSNELTLAVAPAGIVVDQPVIGRFDVTKNPANIGDNVNFTVEATGSGALSYEWYKDGSPLGNATGASLNLQNVAAADAGRYKVTVTNTVTANGQAFTASTTSNEIVFAVEQGSAAEWSKLQTLLADIDALVGNAKYTANSIAALKASVAYTEAKKLTPDADASLLTQAYDNLVKAKNDILVTYVPVTPPTDTGSNSGSTSGSAPIVTPTNQKPVDPSKAVVSTGDLTKPAENNDVVIKVDPAVKNIELPMNAGELLGEKTLQIQTGKITIDIAPDALKQWKDSADKEQLAGSKLQVTVNPRTVNEAAIKSNANVDLKGNAVALDLSIVTGDGKSHPLSEAAKPMKVKMPIDASLNSGLLGMYKVEADGTLTYLGGVLAGDYMEAEVQQGGTYALLEYTAKFTDVLPSHWASNAIQQLAAKHLTQGVSANEYQPDRMITRAEFVELVSSTLKLKEKGELSFTDVAADAWYQDGLAKMVKAGLITGRTTEHFEPNDMITRQELVLILMRAHKMEKGTLPSQADISFSDESNIASWALESVKEAAALGLVQGRSGGEFAPNDTATRAETAQFVLNYLK
ncbi:S-layer homology domain-containing protein [Paenibacillus puldeungensis]|uniref:S-layer homology domain-containing protein n=1 Tax=Paenibacillus puldeungensis TaxID=696536 RepID=A0ABW3RRV9_9BACL